MTWLGSARLGSAWSWICFYVVFSICFYKRCFSFFFFSVSIYILSTFCDRIPFSFFWWKNHFYLFPPQNSLRYPNEQQKKQQESLKIFLFNMLVTWKWLWFIEFVRFRTGASKNDVVKLAYCMTPHPLSVLQSNMINVTFKWPIQFGVCMAKTTNHVRVNVKWRGRMWWKKTQQQRMTKWKVEQG